MGFGRLVICAAVFGAVGMAHAKAPLSTEISRMGIHDPVMSCSKLAGRFGPDGVVETAERQAAGKEVQLRLWGGQFNVVTPAHCLIRGGLARRTGSDGKPYAIGFELRLPEKWNGRFLFQGGIHLAGRLSSAVGGVGTSNPLKSGFAIVTTDSGHRESHGPGGDVDFAHDPQARIDFAYNGVARATIAAKELVQRYYGAPIRRSYFVGCSEGGRQGMIAAQRFPADFDGIAVGAPSLHLANITAARTFRNQQLASFAPKDADGTPDLSQTLSQADLRLVAASVVAECDGLDGLRDGIIAYRRACKFKPDMLLCKPGQIAGCLTSDKLRMITAVTGPAITSVGHVLYPSFPFDSGMGDPAWYSGQITSPQGEDDRSRFLLYTTPPMADTSPFSFNLDEWQTKTAAANALINPASTNLSLFTSRGGKIIFFHGLSDPYMSANSLIDYYDSLKDRVGGEAQAQGFSRLFLAPGMGHCTGGPGPNKFDLLTPLVSWVENGRAPDRLIASGQAGHPQRTRPLCPYPSYAQYRGGDPETHGSFICAKS